ncbi:MAG: hypothetical protein R6W66_01550 [Pelovirga sp.]
MQDSRRRRWQTIVSRVAAEYQLLPAAEKQWISVHLADMAQRQRQLEELFVAAGGPQACSDCAGGCCAHGHNHMTLANLLQFVQREQQPPVPDFTRDCPFLGPSGCLLAVGSRPYNCISFICDIIESGLAPAQLQRFYQLEQQLRRDYLAFAARYQGAAMTGLLLQDLRLNGQSFFTLRPVPEPGAEGSTHVFEL